MSENKSPKTKLGLSGSSAFKPNAGKHSGKSNSGSSNNRTKNQRNDRVKNRDGNNGKAYKGFQGRRVNISFAKNPIICALDFNNTEDALKVADNITDFIGGVKLGLEFFTANGALGVKRFTELGYPVFLDLKFHDIPNTVAQAVRTVAKLNVGMLTIHLSGGSEMIRSAVKAASESASRPMILGVSILTSLDDNNLAEVGLNNGILDNVLRLTEVGMKAGIGGLVCSPLEIEEVRKRFGTDLKIVTPGIRLAGFNQDDQKRVLSPAEALAKGANHLVIGRSITAAPDPKVVARIIHNQLT
jgi:orotidine-5'-phosphate decarboxylase